MRLTALTALLVTLLSAPLSRAQPPPARGDQAPATKTNIIIERQLVRFMTQGETLEWRLEVSNRQGEVIFDTGWVSGIKLEWPLQNQQGETVDGGLYAYTLTIKEPNSDQSRTQRGHVILDRLSNADRVWVTSSSEVGIGASSEAAKLSVSGGSEVTVGGAELPDRVPHRESGAARGELPMRAADETATAKATGPAAPNGTANRVAKFASDGTSLVDSAISEVNGNVGIGTNSPAAGFDYRGSTAAFYTRDIGPSNALTAQSALQLGLSNAGSRFAGVGPSMLFHAENSAGAKSFLGRVSGVWENPAAGAEAGAIFFQVRANSGDANALTERMRITAAGNVGIGTNSPGTRLEVVHPATQIRFGFSAADNGGYLVSTSPSQAIFAGGGKWDGANWIAKDTVASLTANQFGTIQFYTNGGLTVGNSFGPLERMRVDLNGNVGINTQTPTNGKLHVNGAGGDAIYGVSTGGGRGVWGESSTWQGVFGKSHSNAGVVGEANLFHGIYGVSHSVNNAGVYGTNDANGFGVAGISTSGPGVQGDSTTNAGVIGASSSNHGVYGKSVNGFGVFGQSTNSYAMSADGHVSQSRNKGGWVKAMVRVTGANGSIARCYNSFLAGSVASTPPCGFTVNRFTEGGYGIDFGFQVTDRFFSITVEDTRDGEFNMGAMYRHPNFGPSITTTINVFTFKTNDGSGATDASFIIIVY